MTSFRKLSHAWVFACALGIAPAATAQTTVLYLATGGDGEFPGLFLLDPATGEERLVMALPTGMHGLAFSQADGVLYGVSPPLDGPPTLFRIDPIAREVEAIDTLDETVMNIAFHDDVLYGIRRDSDPTLVIINPADATFTDVGTEVNAFRALAIDADGNAYAAQRNGDDLYTVDLTTGAFALVGEVTDVVDGFIGAMAFAPDGALYAIGCPPCNEDSALYTIDLDNLTADFIGALYNRDENDDFGPLSLAFAVDADADGDGIPAVLEVLLGTDPTVDDSTVDTDGDGLSNADEHARGTDLTKADTDGDGLDDGAEVELGTDPLRADSDGDGTPDGAEVVLGTDPLKDERFVMARIVLDDTEFAHLPDVAVDADGRVHTVWASFVPADAGFEIHYSLVDADGTVLIEATDIDDDGTSSQRPAIGVGSSGQVYVMWQNRNQQTWVAVLDPSAEDPADLVVTSGDIGDFQHLRLFVDAADDIHVVGVRRCCNDMVYAKFDGETGDPIVPQQTIAGGNVRSAVDVAADADGNAHIVWSELDNQTVVWMMLDGTDGSVLVDATELLPRDQERKTHTSLLMDADGFLHVVYTDRIATGGDGAEVYHAKFDPSKAAMDGSAADPDEIMVVAPHLLTPDNELWSHYSAAWLDADGNLAVTWMGEVTPFSDNGNRLGPLFVRKFGLDGAPLGDVISLYSEDDHETSSRMNYARGDGDWVAWADAHGASNKRVVLQNLALAEPAAPPPSGAASGTSSVGTLVLFETVGAGALPQAAQDALPEGVEFPDGFVRFVVTGVPTGAAIAMSITFPSDIPDEAVYFKWDATNGWYQFPFVRTAQANRILLVLEDGGAGDTDGVANGTVVDPGGWAILPAEEDPEDPEDPVDPVQPTPVTASSSGGGCSMVAGRTGPFDPTLPGLLLLAAVYLARRRLTGKR